MYPCTPPAPTDSSNFIPVEPFPEVCYYFTSHASPRTITVQVRPANQWPVGTDQNGRHRESQPPCRGSNLQHWNSDALPAKPCGAVTCLSFHTFCLLLGLCWWLNKHCLRFQGFAVTSQRQQLSASIEFQSSIPNIHVGSGQTRKHASILKTLNPKIPHHFCNKRYYRYIFNDYFLKFNCITVKPCNLLHIYM